jgi:glutamate/tyrosine decarboxylase-like PLP-dependent enzyme
MIMSQNHTLLEDVLRRGSRYLSALPQRRVAPSQTQLDGLSQFNRPLPEHPADPAEVLAELDGAGSPATVASAGGRYFGFIIGSSLPAALAANLLAGIWDQNAALEVASPVSARLEDVVRDWLVDLLGLPVGTGMGFVTGATMANFAGLAAARHALLAEQGWDVEAHGLFGAPPITVIAGNEVHVSALKAISMLGLGRERVVRVPVDGQGRMRPDSLPAIAGPTIVCLQAGNVNTGAFDDARQIIPLVKQAGAWVHVDGAFGLWAAASPTHAYHFNGYEQADSWATDAHKWLNVPYDSGLVFVRDQRYLKAAMSTSAVYLTELGHREPSHYVPELSRRARGIEVWAALRSLGRTGLADLVERCCRFAAFMAEGLQRGGCQVLNEVNVNQVLVSFGTAEQTRQVIKAVQDDGTCWAGATVWQGQTAMRISISSWATTQDDIDLSLAAILRIADEIVNH